MHKSCEKLRLFCGSQKTGDVWNEVLIDIDPKAENEKKFRYVLTNRPTPASAIFVSVR